MNNLLAISINCKGDPDERSLGKGVGWGKANKKWPLLAKESRSSDSLRYRQSMCRSCTFNRPDHRVAYALFS